MSKFEFWSVAFFVMIALAITLVWFSVFPLAPAFDLTNGIFHSVALLAAIFGFAFIVSLHLRALSTGWILFSIALLIGLLRELTHAPNFWDTIIANLLQAGSVLIIAVGLYWIERERQRRVALARRDQEQLEKSRAQFQDLYENATDAIFTLDLAGNFRSANHATTALLGYTTDEIRAKNIADVLSPASLERASEMLERALATQSNLEELQPWDYEIVSKDGARRATQVRTRFIWDDGNLAGIHGIARDVTAQKRAEDTLRRRDAILESFTFAAEQFLIATNWQAAIPAILARLGQATAVSRMYIFENYTDARGAILSNQRFEWTAPGITAQIDNPDLQGFDFVAIGFARWIELMSVGKPVSGRVREMSTAEQAILAPEDIQSILCVPIFVENHWWGLIGFDECTFERVWSEIEIDALRTIASTLGAMIARSNAQAQALAHQNEQTALLQLSQDLLTLTDSQTILNRVLHCVNEIFETDLAHIWLVDETGERVVLAAGTGWQAGHIGASTLPLDDSAMGGSAWAIRNRQIVIVDDIATETRFAIPALAIARGIQSGIAVPMLAGERALGALAINSIHAHAFTADHARVLALIANDTAQALERARLFAAETQRAQHLAQLNEITRAALSAINLPDLLQTLADRLGELFNTDGCHISLWDDATRQIRIAAVAGPWRDKIGTLVITPGEPTLTETVLQTARALAIEDVRHTAYLGRHIRAQITAQSAMALPLIADDQKIGAVILLYDQPRQFSADDLAHGEQAAAQVALALAKSKLFAQVQAHAARLSALHAIDLAITSTLDLNARLDLLLTHTLEQMRGDQVNVFLAQGNQLAIVAQRGARNPARVGETNFPIGVGAAGWVAQTGQPLALADVHRDPRWCETETAALEGIIAYLGAPLLVEGQVIGVLDVSTRVPREFTNEEIDFLMMLAGQAAIAIEHARLFDETHRRARELAMLYETTRDLAAEHALPALLQTIVERAARLLNARGGGMYICDEEQQTVRCVVSYNTARDYTGTVLQYGEGAAGTVAATRQPIIIDDYRTWAKRAAAYEDERPFSAIVSVPIFWQAALIGVLHVLDDNINRRFTDADVQLLIPFADQAAIAIANARLFEETQRRAREFSALYDLTRDLATERDLPKLLQTIVARATTLLQTSDGSIYLYHAARDNLELASVIMPNTHATVRRHIQVGTGVVGRVAQTHEPLIINDYQTWGDRLPDIAALGITATVQVPLVYADELIGVLGVQERGTSTRQFTTDDARLLTLFATQAASAVRNARLFEETQRRAREFSALYDIARELVDARDLSTVLRAISERAATLLDVPVTSVYLYDPARADLELVYTRQFTHLIGIRIKMGEGMAGKVAQTREPMMLDDYHAWQDRAAQFDNIPIRAVIEVPMLYAGELIGVLVVHEIGDSTRRFSEADQRLLSLFAAQAAGAVRNAQLFAQTQRRAEHLLAINRVARSVSASLNLDQTLEIIFHETTQVLPADVFFIALYDAPNQELDFRIWVDSGVREPPTRRPLGDNLTSYVITEQKPLLIRDWENEKERLPHARAFGTMKLADSWLGVPLEIGNRIVGVISVQAYRPNAYGADEQQLLTTLADQAAIAIENARLFEETQQRAHQLETLYQVGQTLNSTLDTETILENVTTEAMRVTGATHGCLCIADTRANRYWYRALRGFTPELVTRTHASVLALDQGHNGRAYQTQQIVSIDDVTASPDYVEFVPETHAEMIVPIVRSGQVLGNIDLQSPQVGAFRAANLALLRALANQAGIALENARLFEQAQQRGREQTIVSEVIRALNASLDARQAFPAIAKAMQELTGCDRISMALLDETNEYFVIAALDSPRAELSQGTRLPVSASAAAPDVLAGKTHHTPDLLAEQNFPAEHALVQAGFRSRINIPLVVGEWVIGALNLVSRQPNGFNPASLPPLHQVADAVAIAIENMHLFESEQTRREELAALYDLARALAELNDSDAILNLVAQRAVNTLRITFARIALIEGEHFAVRAGHPARILGRDLRIGQREPLAAYPFCAHILAATTPLLLTATDARIREMERETFFLGVTKMMCFVPLRLGERVLGFAMLGEVRDERREPFTDDKVRLANSIGDQTASALHRAELFAQIESAYLETVLALAQATDAKDSYTANHAQRLAEMSRAMGYALGLTARELEDLRYGATLHDIGKIGVPDAILQKPGRLTRDEWLVMRKHPVIGAQILAPVPRLAGAARIVRHHHERFDGKGYPDGLRGAAIPLGARILTLVDAYSAIVDRRVYKKPRSHKHAISELKKHNGAQFDPSLMEIFLRLFELSPEVDQARQ
jgi:PAS domain S-box-containing protein